MTQHQKGMKPNITVIGVGGAGGNAVNNMISSSLEGIDFIVANTDAQALDHSLCDRRIQLGEELTAGLGAGSKAETGAAAAEESAAEIAAALEDVNMVFITAGMGGGTGTGAAPVIARISRELGILTIGVVTKPFQFEGVHRMRSAEEGLEEMARHVDTLIIIPNQNLFRICDAKTTFKDAFKMADAVLNSGVRSVTDLIVMNGLINLDFADIRSVMAGMGKAMMGMGEGEGDERAVLAAEAAISNPLLDDVTMKGASGVLINITGGQDLTLFEVDAAANRIREEVDPEANIIFGSTFDDGMEGKLRVSVVATGFDAASIKPELQESAGEAKHSITRSLLGSQVAGLDDAPEDGEEDDPEIAAKPNPLDDEYQQDGAWPLEPARPVNGHAVADSRRQEDPWDTWGSPKAHDQAHQPVKPASAPGSLEKARNESAGADREFDSFVDGNTLRKLVPFPEVTWNSDDDDDAAAAGDRADKPAAAAAGAAEEAAEGTARKRAKDAREAHQNIIDETLVEDVTAWITRKYLAPGKAKDVDAPLASTKVPPEAPQVSHLPEKTEEISATGSSAETAVQSGGTDGVPLIVAEIPAIPGFLEESDAGEVAFGHAEDSDDEAPAVKHQAEEQKPHHDSARSDDDDDRGDGGASCDDVDGSGKAGAFRSFFRAINPLQKSAISSRSVDTGRKVLDRLNRLHDYGPQAEKDGSRA